MATNTTTIADLFVPELATSYTSLAATEKNAFFMSGVTFSDPRITPLMDGVQGGQVISMPHFNPLDSSEEANIGNDDNAQKSTPFKITGGYETAIKTYQNKSYSVMDLAALASGGDPMVAINAGINAYWTGQAERRVIAASVGILQDSVANHDSDMLFDISKGTGNEAMLTAATLNNAAGLLGESLTDIRAVCVHPAVFTNLRNQNLITTMQVGQTRTLFNTYGDYLIFVDKNMPVEGDADTGYTYTSFLYGSNVFSFNYGNPGVEYEIDRDPASGNGAGEEILYTRRCDVVLPRGYQTILTEGTGLSIAKLSNAATWNRVWEREYIKFAAVKSKG